MGTKRREFLDKLSALTEQYGIEIAGCGCCESPNLEADEMENCGGYLEWDEGEKRYTVIEERRPKTEGTEG